MNTIADAREIALVAHHGQVDKSGHPYFQHVQRVANKVDGHDEKIVAYLHDVVEKGENWTLDRLAEEGFSVEVVAAVDALTRRASEDWVLFVRRAAANPLAKPVKIADLRDNLAQAEASGESSEKYRTALQVISEL